MNHVGRALIIPVSRRDIVIVAVGLNCLGLICMFYQKACMERIFVARVIVK